MTLVDSVSLSRAIEVQKRCYKFLQLIKNDQLRLTGKWAIGNPHHQSANEAERFKELIAAHFLNLPEDGRPVSSNEQDTEDFANFFISYLFCSFDLVSNPKSRLVQLSGPPAEDSCWCELCSRLTNAPNLRLKKVTASDQAFANSLEAAAVRELISTENISLSEEKIDRLLKDPEFIEPRALIAYGRELIRRCRGEDVDASSLVLWRRFAWEKNGAPKKNFVLKTGIIKEAEHQLTARLKILAKL